MPVILLAKALRSHEEVRLLADDPAAFADLHALCEAAGHTIVELTETGLGLDAVVRRAVPRKAAP